MVPKNFNTRPSIEIGNNYNCYRGWPQIGQLFKSELSSQEGKIVLVIECYHGADQEEILDGLSSAVAPDFIIHASQAYRSSDQITEMVYPDVTDDRVFGRLTDLTLEQFMDQEKIGRIRSQINQVSSGLVLVIGTGATLLCEEWDLLIYADMARWEIQMRMRRNEVSNIGEENRHDDWMRLYKQGYFVDWRVCDQLKRALFDKIDWVLDTNVGDDPKLIAGQTMIAGLEIALTRPFSLVPFFDPGPWGGQWMKEAFQLDPKEDNYAWCFNCVPEENSLLLSIDGIEVEIPAINLVLYAPDRLLGPKVYRKFGAEFPIRFDFLDTMDGGNLSLQVHPLTDYIAREFGMSYTQDESYYMMDTGPGAIVYLGLKEGVVSEDMITALGRSNQGDQPFEAEKYVQTWPVKKHDHVLIPAGTVHCSGKNSMVLEVSATPYIFTFKLWDWGRLGMDGKPRPINIEHGEKVIQWDRTTQWTSENLVNQVEQMAQGDGWREERTGLHELQFIETRRHWFTKMVRHDSQGTVNVLCLVEGDEAIVESPSNDFDPYVIHYAETFIVPAVIGEYTIRPFGNGIGQKLATLKAFVR